MVQRHNNKMKTTTTIYNIYTNNCMSSLNSWSKYFHKPFARDKKN